MTADRVALHERLARAKWEAYSKVTETNFVTYGPEWIYAPDAVMMCPLFNGGVAQPMANLFSPELADAITKHAPDGDMLTPEFRMWWKHMPDFRTVTRFECDAFDWGFVARDTYAGTLADGTVLELQEWDYIWTNDDGQISRWDWFVDSRQWYPFLALIGLDPAELTFQGYTLNFLRQGGVGADSGER